MARLTIRIDFDGGGSIGPGKVGLLEAVADSGSIRGAVERCGMSFRQGWLLLQATSDLFGEPLTETTRGGARGGGTRLTSLGALVVSTYRGLERSAGQAVEPELELLAARLGHSRQKKAAGLASGHHLSRKSLKKKR